MSNENSEQLDILIETQLELTHYKKKGEFADALHKIRYTRGTNIPKRVYNFLDWVAEMNGNANEKNGVGCFFTSEQTIATKMNCSISTVERAIRWLKKYGLLRMEKREGRWFKIFSDTPVIEIIINGLVDLKKEAIKNSKVQAISISQAKEIVENMKSTMSKYSTDQETEPHSNEIVRKLKGRLKGTMKGRLKGGVKDNILLSIQNQHTLPNIKNQYNLPVKIVNNESIIEKDDSMFSNPTKINENEIPKKEYFLKKEVKAILKIDPMFDEVGEENKYHYGNTIQKVAIRYQINLTDQEVIEFIIDKCLSNYEMFFKDPSNVQTDIWGLLYTSLENEILEYLLGIHTNVDVEKLIEEREWDELEEIRQGFKYSYLEYLKAQKEMAATQEPFTLDIEIKPKEITKETLLDIANTYYSTKGKRRWKKDKWDFIIGKLVDEIMDNQDVLAKIENPHGYIKKCLDNICYSHDFKKGRVQFKQHEGSKLPIFDFTKGEGEHKKSDGTTDWGFKFKALEEKLKRENVG